MRGLGPGVGTFRSNSSGMSFFATGNKETREIGCRVGRDDGGITDAFVRRGYGGITGAFVGRRVLTCTCPHTLTLDPGLMLTSM